jgi:hypothetical protein
MGLKKERARAKGEDGFVSVSSLFQVRIILQSTVRQFPNIQ